MELLTKLLYKRKYLTIFTITSSGLTAVIALWWNTQLSGIIDQVSAGHSLSNDTILWAIITILITSGTAYAKGIISGYTCESITHDLRMGYARHFVLLPAFEVEQLNAGEQLSRLQNEISDVSGYLSANLFQILDDGIRFITTLIWLFTISPTLTLTANLPLIFIMMYIVWSSKIIGVATDRSQQAKVKMNSYTDTLLTLFPIIRLYDATRMILCGYKDALKAWENNTVHAERIRARLMSLSALLSAIPLMLLFLVGGSMTINGALTVGTLYIFLNLSGNVSGVMMNMPGYIAAFRQFSTNMNRLSPNVSMDKGRK